MTDRWRGRAAGLAVAITIAGVAGIAAVQATARASPTLVARDASGEVIARLALPDGEFTLRYRNSLYRSLAEERFALGDDGRFRLVTLAADELAVLEEYYEIDGEATPTDGGPRRWQAAPGQTVELTTLRVAATDLGQRTIVVEGEPPIELWRLVDDADPSVLLEVAP